MCVGRIEELVEVCVHLCVQIGCVMHVCMCVFVYMCVGRGEMVVIHL